VFIDFLCFLKTIFVVVVKYFSSPVVAYHQHYTKKAFKKRAYFQLRNIRINSTNYSMIFVFAYWKIFVGWNIIVATVYGFDKVLAWWFAGVTSTKDSGGIQGQRRSRRRRYWRRISEDFLLLLLFACGPLGAWVAMEGLRHKTRKFSFRRRAIMLTIINPIWLILYKAMKT
jgi:uncharacterized membrane protein YsdA (DUF1294 family)